MFAVVSTKIWIMLRNHKTVNNSKRFKQTCKNNLSNKMHSKAVQRRHISLLFVCTSVQLFMIKKQSDSAFRRNLGQGSSKIHSKEFERIQLTHACCLRFHVYEQINRTITPKPNLIDVQKTLLTNSLNFTTHNDNEKPLGTGHMSVCCVFFFFSRCITSISTLHQASKSIANRF